ncbi:hypothetical protein C1X30_15740 [Pseudomonas sp. FW305-BF6]|nr:hypothetical protein C1X28_13875 [Pseudomonas sp. FW305-BF15]PNB80047.1 hypothetical protein C1X30_15740 [Pseudomonas sp. FW305-BF6]
MTRDEWKKTPVAEQDNARLWKPNHSFLIDQWGVSASEMVGLGGIGCRFWAELLIGSWILTNRGQPQDPALTPALSQREREPTGLLIRDTST